MTLVRTLCVFAAAIAAPLSIAAQEPAKAGSKEPARAARAAPSVAPEVSQIAAGWLLLAQGQFSNAAARAQQVLASNPRNPAAMHLAIEAAAGRGGAAAALQQYEQLLGKRGLEEPAALRVVALAVLKEAAYGPGRGGSVRVAALQALVEAGDPTASAALARLRTEATGADLRALAARGDSNAVQRLAAELQQGAARNELASLEALGRSGSDDAIEPIVQHLADHRPEVRGAAAEAAALLERPELVDRLKPLLSDPSSYVRVRGAASLYQLGDPAGESILRELLVSESAVSRLIAVEAMASRPDGSWLTIVRELTNAEEPDVRLGAARLIAPHDPELARQVLDRLASEGDLTIRELAEDAFTELPVGDDFRLLRPLLASAQPAVRVHAATRLVALTE